MAGPFSKSSGSLTQKGGVYERRIWYTQRKPQRYIPNDYTFQRYTVTSDPSGVLRPGDCYLSFQTDARAIAWNKAHKKYLAALGARAELGTALTEVAKSQDMVQRRAYQLYKFFDFLRKGQVRNALYVAGLEAKGVNPKPLDRKRIARDWSGVVLEYSFGWAPLVGDLANAVAVLGGDPPVEWVYGKGSRSQKGLVTTPTSEIRSRDWDQTVFVRVASTVSVSNPNVFLANQLGLLNPLSIIWERIPYSFLVDYVVNVGDFLGSFTATWGLSTSLEHYSYLTVTTSKCSIVRVSDGKPFVGLTHSVTHTRTVAPIPGPTLYVQPLDRLSVNRAVTSIALLLQRLR